MLHLTADMQTMIIVIVKTIEKLDEKLWTYEDGTHY